MAEAETRRTWDFASAAFHDGETAPPLTRRRRERGNASNARVPSSRREELREKGELFHLDKVKVQMTPTNNNTQKRFATTKQHNKKPTAPKKKFSAAGLARKASKMLNKKLDQAQASGDIPLLEELLDQMELPPNLQKNYPDHRASLVMDISKSRSKAAREEIIRKYEEILERERAPTDAETAAAINSILTPGPPTRGPPGTAAAAKERYENAGPVVIDERYDEEGILVSPDPGALALRDALPDYIPPSGLNLSQEEILDAVNEYYSCQEESQESQDDGEYVDAPEDGETQGNSGNTGNQDSSGTSATDGGASQRSGAERAAKEVSGGGGASGAGGNDDEDDDPGRRQRQIANKGGRGQGQQEEEEEDEEQEPLVRVDPSDGYEGPEKPSKPPKVKETSSNHQIWKWVILFYWFEEDPHFGGVWIDDLDPPMTIPYQADTATRTRKTPQLMVSGRGRNEKTGSVNVSLFLKMEEGHNLKEVERLEQFFNNEFRRRLISTPIIDKVYTDMVEHFHYKKHSWFTIRYINGPPPVLDTRYPKNRAKPTLPRTTEEDDPPPPPPPTQTRPRPPPPAPPRSTVSTSSGSAPPSTPVKEKSKTGVKRRFSPRKYRHLSIDQLREHIDEAQNFAEADTDLEGLEAALQARLEEQELANKRQKKTTASQQSKKTVTVQHGGTGTVTVEKSHDVSTNIFTQETIPQSQLSTVDLDLGDVDQGPAIAGSSTADPVGEQQKALAAATSSGANEPEVVDIDDQLDEAILVGRGEKHDIPTTGATPPPVIVRGRGGGEEPKTTRSTLEFPGATRALQRTEKEQRAYDHFREIQGEGVEDLPKMISCLIQKVDTLAGEFYHIPHIRHDVRANSALITLGRKEIKDLTEEVTNHIVDFAEFKKQKEAPKGEKYRTSKLVLSPWVPFKSDDDIWAVFDQSDTKAFDLRMECLDVVAWIWIDMDTYNTYINSFYRKFFDSDYLETKLWGQNRDGRTKLPYPVRDWIKQYTKSIQGELDWWKFIRSSFFKKLRDRVAQKHYDDQREKDKTRPKSGDSGKSDVSSGKTTEPPSSDVSAEKPKPKQTKKDSHPRNKGSSSDESDETDEEPETRTKKTTKPKPKGKQGKGKKKKSKIKNVATPGVLPVTRSTSSSSESSSSESEGTKEQRREDEENPEYIPGQD